jgi:hypothetical protein
MKKGTNNKVMIMMMIATAVVVVVVAVEQEEIVEMRVKVWGLQFSWRPREGSRLFRELNIVY